MVDWAAEQTGIAALVDDGQHIDYPFADEVGTGKGIMLNTSNDISVFCGGHAYNASHIGGYDESKLGDNYPDTGGAAVLNVLRIYTSKFINLRNLNNLVVQ